jgi:ABC-type multidrug transport system ATPase subunit
MIVIKNLSKSFGTKQVLKNLNLKIEDGKVFGLVGINGSGKSTLLRLISGIYESETGSILIDNEDIMWKIGNFEIKNGTTALANENFQINKVLAKNKEKFKAAIRSSQKTGLLVKTNDPVRQIVGHEVGHRVQI